MIKQNTEEWLDHVSKKIGEDKKLPRFKVEIEAVASAFWFFTDRACKTFIIPAHDIREANKITECIVELSLRDLGKERKKMKYVAHKVTPVR